jgi:hypothetical protein
MAAAGTITEASIMALVGSLFAMAGRFVGRLLNTTLGWATLLLFGKVEGRNQTLLLLVALGSLVWVATALGVVLPDVGAVLLAFVPVPDFVDEDWVRLAMLAAAIVLPLAIGATALFVAEADRRPSGFGLLLNVLRGYPFTLVLALTIVVLGAAALVRKIHSLARRWEDAHVAVIVKPGRYDEVVGSLGDVLLGAGFEVRPEAAPAVLSLPPRLLDRVAGHALGELVPDRLVVLRSTDLETLVYPSDVAIAGPRAAVARARAAIAARLTSTPAYLTTSAEAQEIEDELRRVAVGSGTGPAAALREIDVRLARLAVPFDEWETLYRKRLQVERDLLTDALETRPIPDAPEPGTGAGLLVGLAGLGLVAADIALGVADGLARRSARCR